MWVLYLASYLLCGVFWFLFRWDSHIVAHFILKSLSNRIIMQLYICCYFSYLFYIVTHFLLLYTLSGYGPVWSVSFWCGSSQNLDSTVDQQLDHQFTSICVAPSFRPPSLWRTQKTYRTYHCHTPTPQRLLQHIISSSPPRVGENSRHHGAVTEAKRWTVSAWM